MAQDVFISYSSRDKPAADAVCATLEGYGVRCWIAPRDILPGTEWGASIVAAIESSKIMVLVFSASANASQQVKREVERAVSKGLIIVPLRIEDVLPGESLEYFLGTPHWLDAMTPPLEHHLEYLAETVQFLLGRGEQPAPPGAGGQNGVRRSPPPPRRLQPSEWQSHPPGDDGSRRRVTILAASAVIVAVIAIVFVARQCGGGDDDGNGGTAKSTATAVVPSVAAVPVDAATIATWRTTGAANGSSYTWDNLVGQGGKYSTTVTFQEAGSYTVDASSGLLELSPSGSPPGYKRGAHWKPNGDAADQVSGIEPQNLAAFAPALVRPSGGATQGSWQRTSSTSSSETWTRAGAMINGLAYDETLTLSGGRSYTFKATAHDAGSFSTQDGKWHLVAQVMGVSDGTYRLQDANTMTITGPGGGATWKKAN